MDSILIRVESPLQALMAEQSVAMAKQLEVASQAAPDGKVLSRLEQLAVGPARMLSRIVFDFFQRIEMDFHQLVITRISHFRRLFHSWGRLLAFGQVLPFRWERSF